MIINQKYLAKYSPLPVNYNFAEVMNYVPVAQEIWVRPILGDEFLEEIEYQVEKNQVTDEVSTLFTEGGLYQYLAYATCLEGLPFLWTHLSEVGLTKGKSENSESISLKDITYVEAHLRRQVEFLKDSFIKWICSHQDSFPIFNPKGVCPCCDNCCDADAKLNSPNPNWSVYTPKKLCTTLL